MTTSIIYIRVSKEEQAQKEYSQYSQEEKLNINNRYLFSFLTSSPNIFTI